MESERCYTNVAIGTTMVSTAAKRAVRAKTASGKLRLPRIIEFSIHACQENRDRDDICAFLHPHLVFSNLTHHFFTTPSKWAPSIHHYRPMDLLTQMARHRSRQSHRLSRKARRCRRSNHNILISTAPCHRHNTCTDHHISSLHRWPMRLSSLLRVNEQL